MSAQLIDLAEHRRLSLFAALQRRAGVLPAGIATDLRARVDGDAGPALVIVDPADARGRALFERVPADVVSFVEAAGRRVAIALVPTRALPALLSFDPTAAQRARRVLPLPEVRVAVVAHGGVSLATAVVSAGASGPTRSA